MRIEHTQATSPLGGPEEWPSSIDKINQQIKELLAEVDKEIEQGTPLDRKKVAKKITALIKELNRVDQKHLTPFQKECLEDAIETLKGMWSEDSPFFMRADLLIILSLIPEKTEVVDIATISKEIKALLDAFKQDQGSPLDNAKAMQYQSACAHLASEITNYIQHHPELSQDDVERLGASANLLRDVCQTFGFHQEIDKGMIEDVQEALWILGKYENRG